MITTLSITRKVLFEKFHIKHEMEDFFLSFIEGCELKISDKHPHYIFYVKNDLLLFQQETENRYFYVRFDLIWSVFEDKYKFSYSKTQSFIKDVLETHIRLDEYTPIIPIANAAQTLETLINLNGYTPNTSSGNGVNISETNIKLKDYTPGAGKWRMGRLSNAHLKLVKPNLDHPVLTNFRC